MQVDIVHRLPSTASICPTGKSGKEGGVSKQEGGMVPGRLGKERLREIEKKEKSRVGVTTLQVCGFTSPGRTEQVQVHSSVQVQIRLDNRNPK